MKLWNQIMRCISLTKCNHTYKEVSHRRKLNGKYARTFECTKCAHTKINVTKLP